MGFSPFLSPAACQYLHSINPHEANHSHRLLCTKKKSILLFWLLFFGDELFLALRLQLPISSWSLTKLALTKYNEMIWE
jgi:hypothetical protein